jgi:hypothetical protein
MRGRLITATLIVASSCSWLIVLERARVAGSPVLNRPIQRIGDGYVSSATCRTCHPAEFGSWHTSFHRSMTQEAHRSTVKADFDALTIHVNGEELRLDRDGDAFWAEFDDPENRERGEPRKIKRQIALITGSHQQQVYWYSTGHGRTLGELPAIYLIQEREWIPRWAAFMRPPTDRVVDETGRWNAVCINCHTTHGKRRVTRKAASAASSEADSTVGDFGIACEACHGPGDPHARRNQNPFRRYWFHLTGAPDRTIVQPLRLDPQRSSQVCGQCHAVWDYNNATDERAANDDGFLYRPGNDLGTTRLIVQPTASRIQTPRLQEILNVYPQYLQDSFWPDGQIRVSGREYNGLIDSACYRNATSATRTLTCMSCHAMHTVTSDPQEQAVWADTHQLRTEAVGRDVCLECHQRSANVEAHTHHSAASSGSDCYNCHMPYTTYGLLRALRSHTVTSPTVAESIRAGRPNACNLCHLDKTLDWTAGYLNRWYGIDSPELDHDQQTVAGSVLWLLRGDAGQRALAAWNISWAPAQHTAGTAWETPFLALLLNDPYDAVRIIAGRSLKSLPGNGSIAFDPFDTPAKRLESSRAVARQWERLHEAEPNATLLIKTGGDLDVATITRLVSGRDDHRVNLRE